CRTGHLRGRLLAAAAAARAATAARRERERPVGGKTSLQIPAAPPTMSRHLPGSREHSMSSASAVSAPSQNAKPSLTPFIAPGLGLLLFLVGTGLLLDQGRTLPPWYLAAIEAGLGVAALLVALRGWRWLFGPVFFYDAVRAARRGRYVLLRAVYLLVLLVILFLLYLECV